MAFQFSVGPRQTSLQTAQIADAIKEVGQEKRYMGTIRRLGVKQMVASGKGSYGAFAPSANDDPFATASAKPADWRVGWQCGHTLTNRLNITRDFGWSVIFEVRSSGPVNEVLANIQGKSERREVERFVQSVFDLL